MSAAKLGKKLSAEHIAKMVVASTGKKHSPETREKIGAWHRGRKRSPETCARISESMRIYPKHDVFHLVRLLSQLEQLRSTTKGA